ncbi:MAG: hypothetical protein M0P31_19280 [Solirubrobacteraceae bacterium]|nr:hypothetical protein [Solirubrobacteraceae bacterium]
MANCTLCGAPIEWAVATATGRFMPLDPHPAASGNVRRSPRTADRNGRPAIEVLGPLEALAALQAGESLYLSHFATCPRADEARRRSGGER